LLRRDSQDCRRVRFSSKAVDSHACAGIDLASAEHDLVVVSVSAVAGDQHVSFAMAEVSAHLRFAKSEQ
jgi:hypothetical protein